jgi:hypothetical protein
VFRYFLRFWSFGNLGTYLGLMNNERVMVLTDSLVDLPYSVAIGPLLFSDVRDARIETC